MKIFFTTMIITALVGSIPSIVYIIISKNKRIKRLKKIIDNIESTNLPKELNNEFDKKIADLKKQDNDTYNSILKSIQDDK